MRHQMRKTIDIWQIQSQHQCIRLRCRNQTPIPFKWHLLLHFDLFAIDKCATESGRNGTKPLHAFIIHRKASLHGVRSGEKTG